MSNELQRITYSTEQVDLIRSQIAPKASNDELKLFLYQCQRTGLDALSRQIYAIHRWNSTQGRDVMTIQTSIDGFRVIAERSGDYAGQDEPLFTEAVDKLISCKVTVYRFRGDIRYPAAVGVAYWDEYKQTNKEGKIIGLWGKMPHTMLSKVAEAVALRKAYPQDLSGLYTNDEMNQADKVDDGPGVAAAFDDIPDEKEKQILRNLVYNSTLDEEAVLKTFESIELCIDYKTYEKIQMRLEDLQAGFNDVANPNATDAKKQVRKIVGHA